ncbi:Arginase/deacetylase [Panus rudis PR-1116 ss-1]|nr:Arginase/deacetylase [Panus rudis PR-1116 ss-1]
MVQTGQEPLPPHIYLQAACLKHQYIRSKDTSHIVERPERLRAVNIGIAAGLSRLAEGSLQGSENITTNSRTSNEEDALASALDKLTIAGPSSDGGAGALMLPAKLVKSGAAVNLLDNPAVKFIHGDVDKDVYLEKLVKLAHESRENITQDGSEIPAGWFQGDLYLCPTSIDAIQGALGTVCEAVDIVLANEPTNPRAFVAVRPPGHHCGEDTPSGFCFVNNVAVGAAHAHLKYQINRVVIFDIDLHHGNGTQAIAWQINEETYRNKIEAEHGSQSAKPGPQVFYGSIHDVLSYPCEDGKPELIQAASVSIHGPHGQHIENIHLQPYQSEDEFFQRLYTKQYSRIFSRAEEFLRSTGESTSDVLVFISAGFDACEHEYPSMQRHERRVPTSFYYRFARDARAFADRLANGRLISVLEGGYSDRALMSGAMAHIIGLVSEDDTKVDPTWWSLENLKSLEQATKKRRGGRPSQTAPVEPWLQRTLEIFSTIDQSPPTAKPVIPPSTRSLRDRKPRISSGSPERTKSEKTLSESSKKTAKPKANTTRAPGPLNAATTSTRSSEESSDSSLTDVSEKRDEPAGTSKRKVILHVRPPPGHPGNAESKEEP